MKTVRNGQRVWPYCSSCGCRLEIAESSGAHSFDGMLIVKHFGASRFPYSHARKHHCPDVNVEHIVHPHEVAYVGA